VEDSSARNRNFAVFYNNYLHNPNFNNESDKIKILRIQMIKVKKKIY
jgi:beta-galactosidase beta subunit